LEETNILDCKPAYLDFNKRGENKIVIECLESILYFNKMLRVILLLLDTYFVFIHTLFLSIQIVQ